MELFHCLENHQFKVESVIFKRMDDASVPGTQGNIDWVSTKEMISLG
jgi:hypothetical protein